MSATFDTLALRAALRGDIAGLQALAQQAKHATGAECPACGNPDTESNGFGEFRCTACDHRW